MQEGAAPIRLRLLCALGVLAAAAEAGAATEWVFPTVAPEGSQPAQYLDDISRAIERAAAGELRIRVRHGGVVGNELESLDLVLQGRTQLWAGSLGALAERLPSLSVFEIPYLFRSQAEMDRVSRSGLLDRPEVRRLFERARLVPWGVAFLGWRALATQRPVRTPADLRGMAIRSQPAPLHRALWRTTGARAVEAGLDGVAAAFQDRRVEAADLPLLFLYGTGAVEHVRYYTRSNHIMQAAVLVISSDALGKLGKKAQRDILDRGLRGTQMTRASRKNRELEDELLGAMQERGIQVIEPGAGELEAWHAALEPLRAEALRLAGPDGGAVLRRIEEARAR